MSDARHAKQPQAQTDNKIIQEKKKSLKKQKKAKVSSHTSQCRLSKNNKEKKNNVK